MIGISAGHEPGAVGAGAVQGVTLALSYDDGATWQPLSLRVPRRGLGGERPLPAAPAAASSRCAPPAWDNAGNRVEQEIIRAFGLG